MGVYINGMEMPKDKEMLCVNIYPDGKVCVNLDLKCKRVATAVSVPPHGRLIDAGKIEYVQSEDGCLNDYAYRYDINEMPTIIPSSKETED